MGINYQDMGGIVPRSSNVDLFFIPFPSQECILNRSPPNGVCTKTSLRRSMHITQATSQQTKQLFARRIYNK